MCKIKLNSIHKIYEYWIIVLSLQNKTYSYGRKFNEDYLRDLYQLGKSDKKHRFQPQIIRKYIRVVDLMIAEDNVQGLWKYNSLNCQIIINSIVMVNNMIANNMTPAFPTHPGEILKDEIEYRGISQRKLAEEMGIAYSALNEILNARRPVTEKKALLFEAALGVNAEPLLKMQMRYNIQSTRKDATFMKRLSQVRKIAAAL